MSDLSQEQLRVVNAPIENILVSAAAGSGKTTVLVHRIVEKLCAREFEIDDILVVTFTKDAAANMKKKLEDKIKKRIAELKKDPSSRSEIMYLQEQLDKLPSSYIQTLDSFCSRVIKEKGYVIADTREYKLLDQGSVVLDENELDIILSEAAMAAIDECYEDEIPDPDFEMLTRMFGNGRTDDSLAESLVTVYKKLRSLPDYLELCDATILRMKDSDEKGILRSVDKFNSAVRYLMSLVDEEAVKTLTELIPNIRFVSKMGDKKNTARQDAFLAMISDTYRYCKRVTSSDDLFAAMQDTSEFDDTEFNGLPKDDGDGYADKFNDLIGPVCAVIKFIKPILPNLSRMPGGYGDSADVYSLPDAYQGLISVSSDELLERQIQRTRLAEVYLDLIKKTDEQYAAIKAVVHGTDFPDHEHLAKKILCTDEGREYYTNKFAEIYIDEYQDNSELQDAVISCFANDNVFRVGDVKQSIYKFRYANPSMFLKMMEDYSSDPSDGHLFLLNNNYRSDRNILTFVNHIFDQTMSAEGSEIEYDDTQALSFPDVKAGTASDNDIVPMVKFVEHGKGEKDLSAIVSGVVSEVERFVKMGMDYSDICILTKRRKTAAVISSYLNECGYESRYADEISVFEDRDIHGICNVIIAAGNELRDEYLLGILLSGYRISNFTLEEIAAIHLYSKKKDRDLKDENLMVKLRIYAEDRNGTADPVLKERVETFITWFDNMRNDLLITDIGEFIDRVYQDTGVAASAASAEKLSLFKSWLCSNFMRYGSDISTIAARLETMKAKLGNKTAVRGEDNEEGKITCMTYHGSKGLEFPCVIVTELFSQPQPDKSGPVKFDPEYGFVLNDFFPETVRLDKSPERIFLDDDEKLASNAEQIRLLYVALTRAEHHLSVVIPLQIESASRYKSLVKSLRKQRTKKLPAAYWRYTGGGVEGSFMSAFLRFAGAGSIRDKIHEVLGLGGSDSFEYEDDFRGFTVESIDSSFSVTAEEEDNETDAVVEVLDDTKTLIPLFAESYDENGMPVFAKYPYEDSSRIPFKISVSQIKDDGIRETLPINLDVKDLDHYIGVQRGDIGDSAASVGTFIHKIFRFTDLSKAREDVTSAIRDLADQKIIREEDLVRTTEFEFGIRAFAESDIGRRLDEADKACKAEYEKPIVFSVKANDTDDVLVQGIIDVLFMDSDGKYVIVDYKTDRYPEDAPVDEVIEETRKRHSVQVGCYRSAVEVSGGEVKASYVYLVRYGLFVEI